MSVQAIRLQNFMGFQDTGWLELRNINLLFGRNSTGKSAILRALLLLRQSLHSRPQDGPLTFVAEDGLDLGGYRQLVRDQKLERNISFWFCCEFAQTFYPPVPEEDDASDNNESTNAEIIIRGDRAGDVLEEISIIGKLAAEGEPKKVQVQYGLHFRWDKKLKQSKLSAIELLHDKPILQAAEPTQSTDRAWKFDSEYPRLFNSEQERYDYDEEGQEEVLLPDSELFLREGFLPGLRLLEDAMSMSDEDEYGNEKRLTAYSDPFRRCWLLLRELRHDITIFLQSIRYLGPLRAEPERFYYVAAQPGNRLDMRGRHVVQTYLTSQRNTANTDRIDQINHWLDDTGVGKELILKPANQEKTIYELRLQESETAGKVKSNLREVGFGVSQVLPILIQAMLAPEGSTVLIEQPELHLHPAAQAELGDLFIRAAAQNNIRLIIETHSEHLLLRLRRRMAESTVGWITPESPLYATQQTGSVFYVTRENGKSELEKVRLNRLGEITKPLSFKGFFSNDLEEIAALAEASLVDNSEE